MQKLIFIIGYPYPFFVVMIVVVLRRCKTCGFEAHTEEDLEKFVLSRKSPYGRRILCKKCRSADVRKRLNTDDRHYLFKRLIGIIQRCYNPKRQNYPRYGGRGITVCQEWLDDKKAFIDWAQENGFKRGLQIGRIDNSLGYNPENCTWITNKENSLNTRKTTTNYEKETRICSICRIEKPLTEYYRNKSRVGGRDYLCKSCESVRHKNRRLIILKIGILNRKSHGNTF